MSVKKKSNVVNFRRKPRAALGIFLVVLAYAVSLIWIYSTKQKVQTYEVNTGSLTANTAFTGLALREEQIITSSYNGNVNYYQREGTKAKVGDTVYTVDETGRVAQILSENANSDDNSLSEDNLKIIKSTLNSFKTAYSTNHFSSVYDLKADLNSTVLQSMNDNIMANLDAIINDTGSQNLFQTIRTDTSGIIIYSVDGYENVAESELSKASFDRAGYVKNNLKSQDIIVSGNPAYKLITSESWSIYCLLTQKDIDEYDLVNRSTIKIRFVKDDVTAVADFSILHNGDDILGKFTLDKYMVRYATERFLDIEIQTAETMALKIPVSALVEKEFYTIPAGYLTSGGNNNNKGFLVEHYVNNERVTEFVSVNIYGTVDKMCYIDMTVLSPGDVIHLSQNPNVAGNAAQGDGQPAAEQLAESYPVGTKDMLDGVYCVNTGYTKFCPVEILERNAEYCIVKRGTSLGITVYDHIILDGSNISENVMIY